MKKSGILCIVSNIFRIFAACFGNKYILINKTINNDEKIIKLDADIL